MAITPQDIQSKQFHVRMRGFAQRSTVAQALDWLDGQLRPLGHESVPLESCAGRVLADDVTSFVDVPRFQRAMMDGFAVRSADTLGAAPYNRLPLVVFNQTQEGNIRRVVLGEPVGSRVVEQEPDAK